MRAGPGRQHRVALRVGQCAPIGEVVDLRDIGRDQDQTFGDLALLEREQARDSGFAEGIAAEAPDGFGRIGDDAAGAC